MVFTKIPTLEEVREISAERHGDGFHESLAIASLELIESIDGFSGYLVRNNFYDYEIPYSIVGYLCSYLREEYLNKEYEIIGNFNEYKAILFKIQKLYESDDHDVRTLAVIGFVEGITQRVNNDQHMKNMRESLLFEDLQKSLDDVNNFWQGKSLSVL